MLNDLSARLPRTIMGLALAAALSLPAVHASDYVLLVSHEGAVDKRVSAYSPQGEQLFTFQPGGSLADNHPSFLATSPQTQRFLLAAPHANRHAGGHIYVFSYGSQPGDFALLTSFESDAEEGGPYHANLSPDGRFFIAMDAMDEDDNLSKTLDHDHAGHIYVIDPASLELNEIAVGSLHTTLAFNNQHPYDIYAILQEDDHDDVNKTLAQHESHVVVIDGDTLEERIELVVPLGDLHSGAYSHLSQRVYVAGGGGIAMIGTQGGEIDVVLPDIVAFDDDHFLAPWLQVTPNGRFVIGIASEAHDHDLALLAKHGVQARTTRNHFFGVSLHGTLEDDESFIFALDVTSSTFAHTLETVNGGNFAFSPNGEWIVAGDILLEDHEASYRVDVIHLDNDTGELTQVHRFELPLTGQNEDSPVAGESATFSPDSGKAYLCLPEADQLLVVDVTATPPTASFIDVGLAPHHVKSALVPTPTNVREQTWSLYE